MKHYFTDNTDLKSEQSQFVFRYQKFDLLFTSDNGVFSKSMIDYGSRVLLDNIEITNEKTLLDVGCGYGTFGICLNKVYSQLNVDMVDVNDRAIELAKLNAKTIIFRRIFIKVIFMKMFKEVTMLLLRILQ